MGGPDSSDMSSYETTVPSSPNGIHKRASQASSSAAAATAAKDEVMLPQRQTKGL